MPFASLVERTTTPTTAAELFFFSLFTLCALCWYVDNRMVSKALSSLTKTIFLSRYPIVMFHLFASHGRLSIVIETNAKLELTQTFFLCFLFLLLKIWLFYCQLEFTASSSPCLHTFQTFDCRSSGPLICFYNCVFMAVSARLWLQLECNCREELTKQVKT